MLPTAEPSSVAESSSSASHAPTQAWRVEVFRAPGRDDPAGSTAAADLKEQGLEPGEVRVGKGYLFPAEASEAEVREVAAAFLSDPVIDVARVLSPGAATTTAAAHRVLVMPRPGVSDPVARTLEHLVRSSGKLAHLEDLQLATYRAFELERTVDTAELLRAAGRVLANETIELLRVDREDLPYGETFAASRRGPVEVPLLGIDDDALLELSRTGSLSLTLEEMQRIQEHYRALGREPLACELETIAQTWSEHCKHKTLTGIVEFTPPGGGPPERIDNLLRETIGRATRELDRDYCVSVFEDNAGIVTFDKGFDLCIKVETHNHPSAIDPYGGAGTGIGGVIRDVLGAGLGAKPIANTDCFFVGPPDLPAADVPRGSMHPRRILRGVVAGVRDYGNRMGIPTVNGGVWFDEGYIGNPLVYAGTVGILPHECAFKSVAPGDAIVSVGGRTGRDGIHGATFSSIELTEDSEEVSSAAVQIGDPITEKRVLDGMLRARDLGLYRGVTDCGAGGFSSAVGEMGEHTGAEVELSSVPLKYPGLASHEIWISEAQERMVLSVPPEKVDELVALFATEDVEATVIGTFTDTGRLVVKDGGVVVADLAMEFLHKGTPRPVRKAEWKAPEFPVPGVPAAKDPGASLLAILAMPDVASKAWIIRQYDHEVQGTSVVKPLVGVHADGPSDAAVLRPLPDSRRGAVLSCGANPSFGRLDPYAMAAAGIDEAMRNAVAVGADPDHAALLDNFSWGNCDKPQEFGALVLASKACYDAALAYRAPFVSGKDSLNNEYRVGNETLSIPPTLLFTVLGQIPDVGRALTMDLKQEGNALYLVGLTREEFGGSHYLRHLAVPGGKVPSPDLEQAPALLRALYGATSKGLVRSAHDLSEGGLAVAAAEMAFAGDLGAHLELGEVPVLEDDEPGASVDPDALRLFSESCTRLLVEVEPEHRDAFEEALAGFPFAAIGEVRGTPRFTVAGISGEPLIDLALSDLRAAHGSDTTGGGTH